MADANAISDENIANLAAITGLNEAQCKEYLAATNGDLQAAAQLHFTDVEENEAEAAAEASGSSQQVPDNYTGPRTLDGRPAPQAIPTVRSAGKKPQKKKTGLATLSSLGGGHAHDDDDDDDDDADLDPRDPRNTYAGGEKSGLAVQDPSQRSDPKKLLNDIIAKAKSNAQRPDAESPGPSAGPSAFRGSGQTLGGDGAPSRVIPDPNAPPPGAGGRNAPQTGEVQERTLHLWRDGFSIDDGELRRFDDPANANDLRMIQQGRAPLHLMNVRFDEPLDVKLQQHDENWRPLPKVYKPFGSEGRRLGSPVPGDSSAAAASASAPSQTSAPSTSAASTSAPSTSVDESQPNVLIRIQMPDGTRLPARFNLTQTIGDIYGFITSSSPELRAGGWVLATTFPNKDHTDKSLLLGDMAEFKRGGTAMVKKT